MAKKAAVKKAPAKKAAKRAPAKKAAAAVAKKKAYKADLDSVHVTASVELGRTRKSLDDLLNIGEQSLIELEKQVGDPVDILLNGKLYARGEVVTVSENFGVRITEIFGEV